MLCHMDTVLVRYGNLLGKSCFSVPRRGPLMLGQDGEQENPCPQMEQGGGGGGGVIFKKNRKKFGHLAFGKCRVH